MRRRPVHRRLQSAEELEKNIASASIHPAISVCPDGIMLSFCNACHEYGALQPIAVFVQVQRKQDSHRISNHAD